MKEYSVHWLKGRDPTMKVGNDKSDDKTPFTENMCGR
jgi:hypothetical protein